MGLLHMSPFVKILKKNIGGGRDDGRVGLTVGVS